MLFDPWEKLKKLVARLAETFALSFQVVVVILLILFVALISFLMIFFKIFVPNAMTP